MKLSLPLNDDHPLIKWANSLRAYYGHPVYLIGSQITGALNPRDVDVIVAIPDQEFNLRYGDTEKWKTEVASGMYSDIVWKWSDDRVKRSLAGMKNTGLNIDFRVQPQSHFDAFSNLHKSWPPVKLDTR
jgi:hypothetical protein